MNIIDNYIINIKNSLDSINSKDIEDIANLIINTTKNKSKIFIFGNGGSASTATHFACDINKSASDDNKYRVICLNDNIATILAYSNDMTYEDIFIEQLKNFLDINDIVIGISTSGKSKNILKAIEYANMKNITTISLTGYDGGTLKKISKYNINININNTQISEDVHLSVIHMILNILKNNIII